MGDNEKGRSAEPFSGFDFSKSHTRRKQPLNSVMPVNPGFCYAVFLTDAYLRNLDSDIPVHDFDNLCASLHEKSAMNALVRARTLGSLTEGKKFLPAPIVDFLVSVSSSDLYIRFGEDGRSRCSPLDVKSFSTNIIAELPVRNGEFEVCDSKCLWYLRFRDDEPVMFFAAKTAVVHKIIRKFPVNSMEVSPDFIYSY